MLPRLLSLVCLALYTAVAPGANPALAGPAEAAAALRGEALKKLVFAAPKPVPDVAFSDAHGVERRLADWRGRWLVVNFWATWCVPCRTEMPSLDALQGKLGGEDFAVLPIASGRNPLPAVQRFLTEIGAERLPVLLDPKMALAARMGVLGLPVTVIVDPEGNEIARLIGDADWASPEAEAVLRALIGRPG